MTVNVMSEVSTVPAGIVEETPSWVSMRTWSTPVGFGTTTQGWRPISVKIHPNEAPRNGIGRESRARRANQGLSVTLRLRRYHAPASASAAENAANPIINRKDQ